MKQTIYFNLNLDDIHPETSEYLADCGGDKEQGVFKYLFQLIKDYPAIQITLFTTPNWINKSKAGFVSRNIKRILGKASGKTWQGEPFHLTKHPEWCAWLNEQKNFEIAVHGYTHYAPTRSYAQEFKDISYEEAKEKLQLAEKTFHDSRLTFIKGFRPPGWGVSEGLFRALKELNYSFISVDGPSANISELHPTKLSKYKGLVNVPQNWDIATGTIGDAVKLIEQGIRFISAKGHIAQCYGADYIENGLTEKNYENVKALLRYLSVHYDLRFISLLEQVRSSF